MSLSVVSVVNINQIEDIKVLPSPGSIPDDFGFSIHNVFRSLLLDLGVSPFDSRQFLKRVSNEGMHFVAVLLPELGSLLRRCVDEGVFSFYRGGSRVLTSFTSRGRLPKLLFSLFRRIFDWRTGKLLPDPCIRSFKVITQLCFYFKKIAVLPTPEEKVQRSLRQQQSYLAIEKSVRGFLPPRGWIERLRSYLGEYITNEKLRELIDISGSRLRLSSGTSSTFFVPDSFLPDGWSINGSCDSRGRYASLQGYLPNKFRVFRLNRVRNSIPYYLQNLKINEVWDEYASDHVPASGFLFRSGLGERFSPFSSHRRPGRTRRDAFGRTTVSGLYEDSKLWSGLRSLGPKRIKKALDFSETALVRFVPKTFTKDRVISSEPIWLKPYQMAFFDVFTKHLETLFVDDNGPKINFERQDINRSLARIGSLDRSFMSWCTGDLKDASDSNSWAFFKAVFQDFPELVLWVSSIRSKYFGLPSADSKTVLLSPMSKLGGMGSGITFPLMALMIHLSICTEIASYTGLEYAYIASNVYVYGDDFILPRKWFESALRGLKNSGFTINLEKSYFNGPFRESCGGDYFSGVDVTPIYSTFRNSCLRIQGSRVCPDLSSWRTPNGKAGFLSDLIEHAKMLDERGLLFTAERYYLLAENIMQLYEPGFKLPYSLTKHICRHFEPHIRRDRPLIKRKLYRIGPLTCLVDSEEYKHEALRRRFNGLPTGNKLEVDIPRTYSVYRTVNPWFYHRDQPGDLDLPSSKRFVGALLPSPMMRWGTRN